MSDVDCTKTTIILMPLCMNVWDQCDRMKEDLYVFGSLSEATTGGFSDHAGGDARVMAGFVVRCMN